MELNLSEQDVQHIIEEHFAGRFNERDNITFNFKWNILATYHHEESKRTKHRKIREKLIVDEIIPYYVKRLPNDEDKIRLGTRVKDATGWIANKIFTFASNPALWMRYIETGDID